MRTSTLDWQDGQPVSRVFGDIYFSRESGLEESRHVFLRHNRLAERWSTLQPGSVFTIGETGFGTGLNFLAAWQLWRSTAPAATRLCFVSTEAFPLSATEIGRALSAWPELASFSDALLAQYDALAPGFHRFHFDEGRVQLTLLVGDARDTLPQLDANVDAWFLDGFAPSCNPEMWSDTVLEQVTRLTRPGGTFATFTAVGEIRRRLSAQGFAVRRAPGYGKKWHLSCGERQDTGATNNAGLASAWRRRHPVSERHAIIVGGGLAGCAAAWSLAQRGWQVDLLEQHDALAQEASGNAAGVLYARLAPRMGVLAQLILGGLAYSQRLVSQMLPDDGLARRQCGVLQLAFDDEEAERIAGLAALGLPTDLFHPLDAEAASRVAGISLDQGGLFYPNAGWVNPPAWCAALTARSGIRLQLSRQVVSLERQDGSWIARDGEAELARAPIAILAGAHHVRALPQAAHLPIRTLKGQVTRLPATAESNHLGTVLCAEGYVSPAREGWHVTGATFEPHATTLDVTEAGHRENLERLATLSGDLAHSLHLEALDPATLTGRAAYRAVCPDYTPAIGPMIDPDAVITPRRIANPLADLGVDSLPWQPGLLTTVAHGTRGLITAPQAGEILAAFLEDEPAPLPAELMAAVQPARFPIRPQPIPKGSSHKPS